MGYFDGHQGCNGCEYEKAPQAWTEVNERTGYIWKYCCPGTACANWRAGTPTNISCGCHYYKPKYQLDIWDFIEED